MHSRRTVLADFLGKWQGFRSLVSVLREAYFKDNSVLTTLMQREIAEQKCLRRKQQGQC